MPTLYAFFKMSYIKIKQKDIHKISVIFRLFTNLLRTYIHIYMYMARKTQSVDVLRSDKKSKRHKGCLTDFRILFKLIYVCEGSNLPRLQLINK